MSEHLEPPSEEPLDGEVPEEESPDWTWQRVRPWAFAALGCAVILLAAFMAADRSYNPEPRIPESSFMAQSGLLGTNPAFRQELAAAVDFFGAGKEPEIELLGEAYELAFPRTFADRLFGERSERATIFTALSQFGELRFLVVWDDTRPAVIAIESPSARGSQSKPEGLFLALPAPETDAPEDFLQLSMAIRNQLNDLDQLPTQELSNDEYILFGPFARGDRNSLEARIADNFVLTHLVNEIERVEGDISLAAPAFLLLKAPQTGIIRALFLPSLGLVQEPLWGSSSTSSLAHELVHANLHSVTAAPGALLNLAAQYLDRTHPRLYGEVVGDLYERLSSEGRAEEALAFLTGAVASRQTKTEPTLRLLQNQGRLSISEPVLISDIHLLIEFGLLPECMEPGEGEALDAELTHEFYESIDEVCSATAPDPN